MALLLMLMMMMGECSVDCLAVEGCGDEADEGGEEDDGEDFAQRKRCCEDQRWAAKHWSCFVCCWCLPRECRL